MTGPAAPGFAEVAPWLALGLIGFIGFWGLIAFVISRLSGWSSLARAYPAGEILSPSMRWSWQSAHMNLNTNYNAALTIVADPQAVHFSMFRLLRVGHEPFSVPWQDLRAEVRRMFLVQRVALRFAQAPDVTMLISPALAERLAQASGGRFAVPASQ